MAHNNESVAAMMLAALVISLAAATPSLSGSASDGKTLYAGYCADCHGPVAKSDIRGATLDEIKYAMTARMCGEAGASKLTDAQLEAIADTLSVKTR